MASFRPDVPIYAFTDDERAMAHIALTWGTEPVLVPFKRHTDDGIRAIHQALLARPEFQAGDRVVVTAGLPLMAMGLTNMVHVTTLGRDW